MDNKFYWYWISTIPGIGNKRIEQLVDCFGSVKEIYNASEKELKATNILKVRDIEYIKQAKNNAEVYNKYLDIKKKNIRMITIEDTVYPKRLKNIYDRPVCLYVKGRLPAEDRASVAVIGARVCTEYGRQTAYNIGRQLSLCGINVISGLARGIDGAAHTGALSCEGETFGILAGGCDVCYPRENIGIYERISETGGIISEYPPQTEPLARHFPLRNRIISGLSDIVVVVEAREKSGSLITVDMALEQNKTVMAVPGRICDRMSDGCNNLIKLGAGIVTAPRDILEALDSECHFTDEFTLKEDKNYNNKIKLLAREEEMLYSCLDLTPKNINNIIEETGFDFNVLMENLVSLEFNGLIKEVSKGYYIRTQ